MEGQWPNAGMTDPNRRKLLLALALMAIAALAVAFRAPGVLRGLLSYAGSRPTEVNPVDGLTYVWIPAGSFQMGCPPSDVDCDGDREPVRQVTIAQRFLLGEHEVTQGAYEKVTGKRPSHFTGNVKDANRPVEQVTWDDASAYCRAVGGRLPTDAEWQYAAKAGGAEALYGPLDQIAWYASNAGTGTHPIKQKLPNAWGLYDMLGNVSEWVENPHPVAEGQVRPVRGGSWDVTAQIMRWAARAGFMDSSFHDDHVGFRCVWK